MLIKPETERGSSFFKAEERRVSLATKLFIGKLANNSVDL